MDVRKAVITAAGPGQRALPLQTLVDCDGAAKSALQIILEEIRAAEISEIAVVVQPGDQTAYREAAGPLGAKLHFIEQARPLGYGHAVGLAREFTGGESFLLCVGDHLYVRREERRCAQQLVATARAEKCAVSAVQATHESRLPYYGAIGGRRVGGAGSLYEITDVLEKPTPTEAEQRLIVPGLRAGHYLCFFGMHVLTPTVMALLAETERAANGAAYQLSPALARLGKRERYLASEVHGRRYNIGAKYGLLRAQLALGLAGGDREEVLSQLVELLAERVK